jgi:hypothetical protein
MQTHYSNSFILMGNINWVDWNIIWISLNYARSDWDINLSLYELYLVELGCQLEQQQNPNPQAGFTFLFFPLRK